METGICTGGMSIISTFDVESLLQLHQGRREHLNNCQKGWDGEGEWKKNKKINGKSIRGAS